MTCIYMSIIDAPAKKLILTLSRAELPGQIDRLRSHQVDTAMEAMAHFCR